MVKSNCRTKRQGVRDFVTGLFSEERVRISAKVHRLNHRPVAALGHSGGFQPRTGLRVFLALIRNPYLRQPVPQRVP